MVLRQASIEVERMTMDLPPQHRSMMLLYNTRRRLQCCDTAVALAAEGQRVTTLLRPPDLMTCPLVPPTVNPEKF